jgi:glycosyltransferase involved in cell wall biosynthesis
MFPMRRSVRDGRTFTVLFAGNWSLRKGCDVLAAAVARSPDTRLIHIGGMGDLAFPDGDERFIHHDAVPQSALADHYAGADVLVLASREDGFGLVLAQALASGLPLICTDRTGGSELAHTPGLAARILVIPSDDVDALAVAIGAMRDKLRAGLPPLTEADRQTLSWKAYARRYADELARDLAGASA